jgi:hypothetical protein
VPLPKAPIHLYFISPFKYAAIDLLEKIPGMLKMFPGLSDKHRTFFDITKDKYHINCSILVDPRFFELLSEEERRLPLIERGIDRGLHEAAHRLQFRFGLQETAYRMKGRLEGSTNPLTPDDWRHEWGNSCAILFLTYSSPAEIMLFKELGLYDLHPIETGAGILAKKVRELLARSNSPTPGNPVAELAAKPIPPQAPQI